MPKSKKAPALLEVFHRGEVRPTTNQPPEPPAESPTPPTAEQAGSPETPAPESSQGWLETQGDQVRFSLSTLTLAISIAAAMAIVVVTFVIARELGHRAGWRAANEKAEIVANDPFREIRQQQPSPELLEDLELVNRNVRAEKDRQRRETLGGGVSFHDDLNYIWIERFNSEPEAKSAQSYLEGHEVGSRLVERNGKWILISTQGFEYGIPEQKTACQKLSERIREFGRQYFAAGGRYRFDCFVKKKLPGENW